VRILLSTLAGLLLVGAAGGALFVWSGVYDISATDQHLRPTYHLAKLTMRRAVERRAADIAVPPLGGEAQLARGAALFRAHCVQCHGAPGVAPEPFALGLTPLATPLARSGRERTPAQLYWVVKNGIKMTAMPAWDFRIGEDDLWALVAFMKELPRLSAASYRDFPFGSAERREEEAGRRPDPKRGKKALEQYGCIACHEIPALVGPEARLGPTLHGIGAREFIGGVLPNTPQNMVRWLRNPRAYSPNTAMPAVGLTERDARDIAAHLETLK
jgi:mono/diheme cytochrome c family protein